MRPRGPILEVALALLVASCSGGSVTANFTGVTVLADFDPGLAIARIHVKGTLDDGSAAFKEADFTVTSTGAAMSTQEEPIAIVLDDRLVGRRLSLAIGGFDKSSNLVATGTAGTTLEIGVLISLPSRLRPPATCGNGVIEPGETCDDGNATSGDGCSDKCAVEPGFACVSEPSTCVPPSEIVYAEAAASCTGDGSMARPFCSIQAAADTPRAQVVFVRAGLYREQVHLTGVRLGIYAEKGAVLETGMRPALAIDGRASVTIRGLVIRGSGGLGGGLTISDHGTSATLISAQVGPGGAIGVDVGAGAVVDLLRTRVAQNAGGGLRIASAGPHRIENDVIASNGSTTSSIGGVLVSREGAGTTFVNDTIADNTVATSSRAFAGVRCDGDASVINAIVWGNHGGAPLDLSHCRTSYSDIGPYAIDPSPLGSSFTSDPKLTTDDRIAPDSPCKDRGDPTGVEPQGVAPSDDFDGNPRPKGQGVDVGAFEVG